MVAKDKKLKHTKTRIRISKNISEYVFIFQSKFFCGLIPSNSMYIYQNIKFSR